jgi:hypothetical protein
MGVERVKEGRWQKDRHEKQMQKNDYIEQKMSVQQVKQEEEQQTSSKIHLLLHNIIYC